MIARAHTTAVSAAALAVAVLTVASGALLARAQEADTGGFSTTTTPADAPEQAAAMKRVVEKAAKLKAAAPQVAEDGDDVPRTPEPRRMAPATTRAAPVAAEAPIAPPPMPAVVPVPQKRAGRAPVSVEAEALAAQPPQKAPAASVPAAAPNAAALQTAPVEATPAEANPIETGAIGPPAPPPVEATKFSDWMLECIDADGFKKCALRQTVTDSKGRRIVQLMARHTGKTAYLEVMVPIGISIPFGVELQLTETIKLSPRLADCLPSGCRAVAPLDEKTLANFRAAKSLAVIFQDSKSGKVLKINGSISGFTDGVGKVSAGS